ncbi:mitochondrial export translocase Oxa2 [Aspergillus steynii IBT 23096]|uniref:Mitochondrial export translocase Oxa2 n=1 Tax=Aspergillus steynii IBT 23096 TaxID=1392250 RepID=A0A2I2G229_9EURO|nr:mitochondrial export translocase Oxa2 [Aspergillus steynii IBT 23096]PLB46924.1 mitochondrial export translocase Oxa2 [Aspergillus steynii IBT 23096]
MRSFHSSLRSTRRSAFQHQVRHFHPTRPRPFVAEALSISSGFIYSLHAITGLPWVVSLPLTALVVRTTVAMPLQIYTKIQARRERDMIPLVHSWRKYYQDDVRTRKLAGQLALPGAAKMEVLKAMKGKQRALHKRWNVARFWKPLNFLQAPIWISIMESIRAMSGSTSGLVPYLLSFMEPSSSAEAGAALQRAVEPSLATEGALWFPDLMAGDPTGILPAMLTLSILLNVRTGWKAPALSELSDLPRIELAKKLTVKGLRAFIQVLALNVGLSAYYHGMPAALMVYWITSTNTATLQTYLLEKYMIFNQPLKPWRQMHIAYTLPGEKRPSQTK